MRNAHNKYLPIVVWGLLALTLVVLALPWPRVATPFFGQNAVPSPGASNASTKTTLIYGQSVMPVETLIAKMFGRVPVAVPTPQPAAKPTPAPTPETPKFGPDPGLRSLGSMIVDQSRKWLLSDPTSGLTFAIAPGEAYAGWFCVAIDGSFLILERGGIRYRVATN